MKWSEQKCRKVALIISLSYTLLGVIAFHFLEEKNYDNLLVIFYPVALSYFALLFSFGYIGIPFLIIVAMIIWGILYGIIWLIKGKREG